MSNARNRQGGFAQTIAIVAIGLAAAIGLSASFAFRQANATSRGLQKEQVRGDLSQLAKQLALMSTPDSSGILTAPAFVTPTSGTPPTNGGKLPSSIATRTTTPQGTPFGYCPVKLGDTAGAGNRIATGGTPGSSTILFALISPGADRVFQTTCPDAIAGTSLGDDAIFRARHSDVQRVVYEAAADRLGHSSFQAAEMRCAVDGKLFQPFATGKDARGCK